MNLELRKFDITAIKPDKVFNLLSEFLVKSLIIEKNKTLPMVPINVKIRKEE